VLVQTQAGWIVAMHNTKLLTHNFNGNTSNGLISGSKSFEDKHTIFQLSSHEIMCPQNAYSNLIADQTTNQPTNDSNSSSFVQLTNSTFYSGNKSFLQQSQNTDIFNALRYFLDQKDINQNNPSMSKYNSEIPFISQEEQDYLDKQKINDILQQLINSNNQN
jgi:hypothetical protein